MVLWKFNGTESHRQCIIGKKSSCEKFSFTDNVFDCFHCLKASDDSTHSSDNAGLFTSRYCVLRRRIFKYTSITWSFSWNIGHKLAFETDDSCMREWFLCHDTGIIDQEFCRKVIGSVNNKVVVFDDIHDILGCDELAVCIYFDIRIDCLHGFFCRLYFCFSKVCCCMDNLSLKIGKINFIRIGNSDRSYTCCRQIHSCRCSKSTCPNNQYTGVQEFFLSFGTNLFEDDMTGITL